MSTILGRSSIQMADIASAATVVLTGVTTSKIRITGTTNISAITMAANQLLFVLFNGALTITHNATSLILPANGNNLSVQAGDTCILAADASANVRMWSYNPATTRQGIWLAQGTLIEWVGRGNIAEAGDALNFNGFAAGYAFNNGPIITQQNAYSVRLINDSSSASAEVARIEGMKSGSAVNNDEVYVSRWMKNGAGTQAEVARLGARITDITNGSEDGEYFIALPVNGTFAGGKRIRFTPDAVIANQFQFPATEVLSTDPNNFDAYEEGTSTAFTPVLTATTPGNLAITYSVQLGTYTRIGRVILYTINIVTSSFTHTTASGNAVINGLPFTSANVTDQRWHGALQFGGITKAGYTQYFSRVPENSTQIVLVASGSGQAPANVLITDMPTGGSVNLRMDGMYYV